MPLGALAPLPLRLGGSPTEGWTAAQHARLCATLCAVKRAAPLAIITCTSTNNSISVFKGQAGSTTAYRPTITVESTGTMLLTFASSYADEYGVERPFSIRGAKGVATAAGIAVACELVSKQSVRVRRFVGGTLTNGQQIVVVW